MINMRKEVRGGRGRHGKLEGVKCLKVGDGMRVRGEVIGCPRGFGGWEDVGRGEEEEFTGEGAQGSTIWTDGEGDKEDFRGVKESNNRFVADFLQAPSLCALEI
jgi:hypothetical protein